MASIHDQFEEWWDLSSREILKRPQNQCTEGEWLARLQIFMGARAAHEAAEASKALRDATSEQRAAVAEMKAASGLQARTACYTLALAIGTFLLAFGTFWIGYETRKLASAEPPPIVKRS